MLFSGVEASKKPTAVWKSPSETYSMTLRSCTYTSIRMCFLKNPCWAFRVECTHSSTYCKIVDRDNIHQHETEGRLQCGRWGMSDKVKVEHDDRSRVKDPEHCCRAIYL